MHQGIWNEGYNEVGKAIEEMREMKPCPYIEGSLAALRWQDGVNAAWEDECPYRDELEKGN